MPKGALAEGIVQDQRRQRRHEARFFCDREEFERWDHPDPWTVPPEECLECGYLPCSQVELRLVMQLELALAQSGSELGCQLQGALVLSVEGLVIEGERGISHFRSEHCDVRTLEKSGTVVGVSVENGDSDARADLGPNHLEKEGLLDARGQAFSDLARL